ncbi:MAG: DUF2141 domain-containing protein [Bacteroidales bacterium]
MFSWTRKATPIHLQSVSPLQRILLNNNSLRIFIPITKQGSVAISVLDDENANGKMDFIFGIMPKEGFGFSNNPPVRSRKAPPFSITSFVFKGGNSSVTVDMKYI